MRPFLIVRPERQLLGLQLPSLSDPENSYLLDQPEDTLEKEIDIRAAQDNHAYNELPPTIRLSSLPVFPAKH